MSSTEHPQAKVPVARWSMALAFSIALLACESGRSAPPLEPSVTSGINLTVSRAIVSAPRTWNAIVDIGVARTGNFSGTVDLSIEGLPPGVSGAFTTPTLILTAAGSRVNFEVGSTAAYGTYPLIIRANGAGVSSSTAAISLVVPRPSFVLQVNPDIEYFSSTDALTGDSSVFAQITGFVERDNGFRGPVEISVTGLPAGVTAGVISAPSESVFWSVGLTIPKTVGAGTYPIAIQARALDAEPRSTVVNVVVRPR
jgi:hypothetical protein